VLRDPQCPSPRRIELHEKHLVERRAEHSQRRPVDQDFTVGVFEGCRDERRSRVVQPFWSEIMAGGDSCDGRHQIPINASAAVDVAGSGTKAVPREERSADDDNGVLRAVLG
jgi:hypothetical protein